MTKSISLELMEQSLFMTPEMEAALQLIQLGSESDTDAITFDNKKRIKLVVTMVKVKGMNASTSDVTSTMRFVTTCFLDEIENAFAKGKRKRKKFRLVVEIYDISS
ncbi:hypothetical protein CTI12_AA143500 [Artemisia annua]|uniref:Uncharacterized protein n=1 Tax=Artemisia annua TaxID=35608 RepID=A0A2U1PJM0_ARTAN|nr:hypothetical protein CTI12_AA143500 [Artemisia annua]